MLLRIQKVCRHRQNTVRGSQSQNFKHPQTPPKVLKVWQNLGKVSEPCKAASRLKGIIVPCAAVVSAGWRVCRPGASLAGVCPGVRGLPAPLLQLSDRILAAAALSVCCVILCAITAACRHFPVLVCWDQQHQQPHSSTGCMDESRRAAWWCGHSHITVVMHCNWRPCWHVDGSMRVCASARCAQPRCASWLMRKL